MRNKWKDWAVFQELEQQYGTFTAIAMMEDASKDPSFLRDRLAPREMIVVWHCTEYEDLWRNRKCSG